MRHEPSPPLAEYLAYQAGGCLVELNLLSGEELLEHEQAVLSALDEVTGCAEQIIRKIQEARAARLAASLHAFEGQGQGFVRGRARPSLGGLGRPSRSNPRARYLPALPQAHGAARSSRRDGVTIMDIDINDPRTRAIAAAETARWAMSLLASLTTEQLVELGDLALAPVEQAMSIRSRIRCATIDPVSGTFPFDGRAVTP